jgi:hypothetical protein
MPDSQEQFAVLLCAMCNRETEHQVTYAGRLLATAVMRHDTHDLRKAYVKDLEHRLATKPWRIVRRLLTDPGYLFTGLPKAIRKQPKKFIEEAKELRKPKDD